MEYPHNDKMPNSGLGTTESMDALVEKLAETTRRLRAGVAAGTERAHQALRRRIRGPAQGFAAHT